MFKLKNKLIRFRPTILSLFFMISLVIFTLLIYIQYNSNKKFALELSEASFERLSYELASKIEDQDEESYDFLTILSSYDFIDETPISNKKHSSLKVITTFLQNKNYIYSVYFAKNDSSFYELVNLEHNASVKTSLKAPENSRWLVIKIYEIAGKKLKFEEFLDSNLNLLQSFEKETNFKVSTRPWFIKAINSNTITKTEPYLFSSIDKYGISYVKKIKNKDLVIGLDITSKKLEEIINSDLNEESKIFFYKTSGELLVSNHSFKDELINKQLFNFTKEDRIVSFDSKEYLHGKFFFKNGEILQILFPLDKLLQPSINQVYLFIVISFSLFLIIGVPLIIFASNLITKPIEKIVQENNKIKNRQFKKVKKVDSIIVEIDELSESLLDLSESVEKYQTNQKDLMDSFIKLIAVAIDEKSEYTGAHCKRVPELVSMIVDEINSSKDKAFEDFEIKDEEELREITVSAWLHDCGKVIIPEYVVDKATKLETIYNRIHEIRTRFEVIYRDLIIKSLEEKLQGKNIDEVEENLKNEHQKLKEDFEFIAKVNIGGEFLKDEDKQRVETIAKRTWYRYFDNTLGLSNDEKQRLKDKQKDETLPVKEDLLVNKPEHIIKRDENYKNKNDKYNFKMEVPENLYDLGEIYNLTISAGTLTKEERYKIQEHIVMTIKMLEELPFPEELKNVPLYAGAHHETLVGTGYPRKLKKENLPLVSRIIAFADVFEALTASDRPYKSSKTISESVKILHNMVKKEHLDKNIFEIFLKKGIYKEYAKKYLNKDQIDEINLDEFI